MVTGSVNLLRAGLALLLLSGCATLNESECRNADWRIIGLEDGSRGRLESYIGSHRSACAKYNVSPDLTAYQGGRYEGLVQYCTEANGFTLGRTGSSYNGVCPPHLEDAFKTAYLLGQDINRTGKKIRSLQNAISLKQKQIEKIKVTKVEREQLLIYGDLTPTDRYNLLEEIKGLDSSIGPLEGDIYELLDQKEQEEIFMDELQRRNTYQ